MALLFIDGFDWVGTTPNNTILQTGMWNFKNAALVQDQTGRDGTGISVEFGGNNAYIGRNIGADQSANTCIFGLAYYKDLAAFVNGNILRIFRDTGGINEQLSLYVTSGGLIQVRRNTTVLATGSTALSINTWYYIEFKFLVHNSAGTIHVKLNGVDEIAATGSLDTQNNGTDDSVQSYRFEADTTSTDWFIDDHYMMNTAGTINTDFLGDIQVKLLLPDTDDTAAWTRSAGSVNADLVDDPKDNDGDTTYVHSATATTQDWYNMPNGAANIDEVYGVQTSIVARKDDATVREVRTEIKAPTTQQNGATNALTTVYTGYTDMFETKDATLAWDTTALDALLIGPNVVS